MHDISEGYNNFKNKLQEEKLESKYPYPRLEPCDTRRKMTDRQIIERTINMSQSYFSKEEQDKVYKLLVKCREVFSLRDEVGTCPNIEVDLLVIDKSLFFIRPFHVKGNRPMIDQEMQGSVHLGILKKDMSLYSSPIMLIARKNSSLNRIITNFRCLNSRLQRVNLAFPLIMDTFAILQNSKCECLSILDLKDVYNTIKLSENSKPYCSILLCFGSAS